ncbi:MAG: helix-turn-helix domain-containing protein [Pseudonocardiaceae bacterium]
MVSASGTPVVAIARLVAADAETVRGVIHAFNEIGLDALDSRWAGGVPAGSRTRPHPRRTTPTLGPTPSRLTNPVNVSGQRASALTAYVHAGEGGRRPGRCLHPTQQRGPPAPMITVSEEIPAATAAASSEMAITPETEPAATPPQRPDRRCAVPRHPSKTGQPAVRKPPSRSTDVVTALARCCNIRGPVNVSGQPSSQLSPR